MDSLVEAIVPMVGRVEAKLDRVLEQQSTHEARIRALEHKLTWKNVVVSAIVASVTAIATVIASGCGAPPPVVHPTRADMTRADRDTVRITELAADGNGYTGTGWFEAPDKIMTAGHMCEDTSVYNITTYDGSEGVAVPVMDSDTEPYDICTMRVIGVEAPAVLKRADRAPVQWDHVYYVGYPQGSLTVQEGIVVGYQDGYVRVAIPGYPGASGSALLNDDGEVVGVLHGYYPYDFNNILFAPTDI